jgi:hypothetical protein
MANYLWFMNRAMAVQLEVQRRLSPAERLEPLPSPPAA